MANAEEGLTTQCSGLALAFLTLRSLTSALGPKDTVTVSGVQALRVQLHEVWSARSSWQSIEDEECAIQVVPRKQSDESESGCKKKVRLGA